MAKFTSAPQELESSTNQVRWMAWLFRRNTCSSATGEVNYVNSTSMFVGGKVSVLSYYPSDMPSPIQDR